MMEICKFVYLLSSFVQVKVNEGIIEGLVTNNEYGCPYFSFKGIPYAEPPIGDIRFKAPQPKKPWDGVWRTTKYGSSCWNYELITTGDPVSSGSEDCLYLNVFSPDINSEEPLPVMVYIHGGGFFSGSGSSYKPDYLIRKNVILVTFNYRLEVLGFLSLGTEDIPGNAGMKDQVTALRWIKNNIKSFGGDPDNITIFGESVGGFSVSYHLISPMSKGLFKRAITQSGTITSKGAETFGARERAILLATELGCYSTNDKEIYECLKAQPAENLVMKQVHLTYAEFVKGPPIIYFGVVQEKKFGDNERFTYGNPFNLLRNGIHEGVEVMNGYTQDEGILDFLLGTDPNKVYYQANHFLQFFAPEPYKLYTPLSTQLEIGKKFKEFYMKNQIASKKNLDDLLKYLNFEVIVYGTMSQQKIIAKKKTNKMYFYKFTCISNLNLLIYLAGIEDLFNYRPVVAHTDDLGYIFPINGVEVHKNSTEFKMIDQVTTLWTNFAKYGDPTPDDNLGVKWLPYTIENQEYLDIGENLVPGTCPDKEETEFWENNYRDVLPEYAP